METLIVENIEKTKEIMVSLQLTLYVGPYEVNISIELTCYINIVVQL